MCLGTLCNCLHQAPQTARLVVAVLLCCGRLVFLTHSPAASFTPAPPLVAPTPIPPTHPTPPSFQILTALSTVLVLKRRLSRGQWMGIACIVAGLALRALPGGGSAGGTELHAEQWVGAAMIVVSACLYTVLVSVCECTQRAGGGCEEDWVGALGGQGAMVVLLAHTHIRAPSSACTFLHAGDG